MFLEGHRTGVPLRRVRAQTGQTDDYKGRRSCFPAPMLWLSACIGGVGGDCLKSILLIDDSRFMRQANEKALTRAGYGVVTASDGEEGLLIAHSRSPDLILLDMLLPKLGGQQVLQALRSDPVASIPVVVLSSLPEKNAARLIPEGATAYFEKSKLDSDQNAESLLQIVKNTLEKWKSTTISASG